MKKLYLFALFVFSLFLSGCVHHEEKVVTVISSFEDSGNKVSESSYFKGQKKDCDWLVLMYMDGDNSLEYSLREDFNEVEQGLSLIRNVDGSAKSGFYSVRVVVLWDGRQKKDSRIFELGADIESNYAGENTINIQNVGFIKKADNEVNMSSGSTLTDFIKWADNHYSAGKGKILHVADHGSGPGPNTRAMCEDSTAGTSAISSKEFASALTNAGAGNNKFSALLFDICLGSSIEDAYEFRNLADYMIASPNTTPGPGFDYVGVMQCFNKENDSNEKIAVAIGQSFEDYYKGKTIVDSYTGEPMVSTVTVTNLSAVENCADKIDALADSVLLVEKQTENSFKPYLLYNSGKNTICYKGTVNWLFDIGDFARLVEKDSKSSETVKTAASNVKTAASNVKTALFGAIVYSWRWQSEKSGGNDYLSLYTDDSKGFCGLTICGGMANSSYTYDEYGKKIYDKTYPIPSWYITDIAFGSRNNGNSGWAKLIATWFGVYSN